MTLWEPFYPEAGTAGERRGAVPPVSHRYNGGELGQQIRQRPPQVSIVLLQTFQLIRVQAAVAVGMDCRLIEIICTAPLEGHKLLDSELLVANGEAIGVKTICGAEFYAKIKLRYLS